MIELRPHEERFDVKPIGIRYICEFCNEGEMIFTGRRGTIVNVEPPKFLFQHRCNKCGKTMDLPRSYPYVEWEAANNDQPD